MDNFYAVLDKLKELLEQSEFNNKVTYGELTDIDLDKMTTFPLAHIMVDRVRFTERTIDYTINLLVCDIVDIYTEEIGDDFDLNSNIQDIQNTQLHVLNQVIAYLRRLDLVDNNYIRIEEDVEATPFLNRFENMLTGWEATLVVSKFNDVSIC